MATASEAENVTLSDLFDNIWTIYEFLETTNEATNSEDVQIKVEKGVQHAERAIRMVNDLNLFTTNEHIDEVTTNKLRYMLLPAILGYFTMKLTKLDRFEVVKKSQIYFIDFLRLCKLYDASDVDLPKPYGAEIEADSLENTPPPSKMQSPPSLEVQNQRRLAKIDRYKKQKQVTSSLAQLYQHVKQEHVEEEIKRKYYTTLQEKWLIDVTEMLESIDVEIPLLEHMSKMKSNGAKEPTETKKEHMKSEAFRPFIITKNELQKKVYGIGYPSMPTYTVDEFYDERVRQGIFPAASGPQRVTEDPEAEAKHREEEDEKKEDLVENDDEDTLQKARDWDDWKDDHRRGWGNTQNKG